MGRPRCPNHTCEMDKTDEPRIWICPVSGAEFEAEADDQSKEIKYDKFGQPLQEWKITPLGDE